MNTEHDRYFYNIAWFMEQTGLTYDRCAKLVREIKSVSDAYRLPGIVSRYDMEKFEKRSMNDE